MRKDEYALGYSAPIVSFMAQRTAEAHSGFFLPYVQPGSCVLDAGCGPGTIMLGLARKVAPGHVIGIDLVQQKHEAKDPQVGRTLARLMRQAGFSVDTMTACYEVISDLLMKMGPVLAEQFTIPGGFCNLQDRPATPSTFVALAWCEATGHAV